MKKLLFISLLLSATYHYGQVGIGTPAPEPSAQLDIVSNDRGLLIPRIPLVDPNERTPIIDLPDESLLVYNTATTAELQPGFYYWKDRWLRIQDQNDGSGGSETLTSLIDNGDGTLTYSDENGDTNILDIGAMETVTSLTQDTTSGILSYTDENAAVSTAQIVSSDTENGLSVGADGGAFLNTNGLDATDDAWINNETDNRIELATESDGTTSRAAGTEIVITDNGQIGIGLTNPQADLQVNEGALIDELYIGAGPNTDEITNTTVGREAMTATTNTGGNTAFGYRALRDNESGNNTAIGSNTLLRNTTGGQNTAIGNSSLIQNTTGDYNIAIGARALPNNTTASVNLAMGHQTLGDVTTGGRNIVIGTQSGRGITTGSQNVIIGHSVTGLPSNLTRNIILADGQGRQRIRVVANGDVGIGTDTPTQKLDIDGKVRVRDLSGTADLTDLVVVADATTGELKARSFGALGTDGTDDAWVNNDANNRIELATESDGTTARAAGTEMVITNDGRLGIGLTNPGASLQVADHALIDGITVGRGINNNDGTNTVVGSDALSSATVGRYNTAIGRQAIRVTEGNGNTALGCAALANSNASYNTAIGGFALQATTTGNGNIGIGYINMRNFQTGSGNIAIGNSAMYEFISGESNTLLGTNTGRGITNGSFNTIIGARVAGLDPNLSNNIIIADGQGNQRIRVLNNGDMGIGTDTPTQKLDVDGKVRVRDLSGATDSTDLIVVASATTGELKAQTLSNLGADGTDDAWVNNDANNRIELATESDGTTARASETEVIITDSGRMGIGLGTANPITKLQVGDWARIDGVDIGRGRNTTDVSNTALGDGALATVTTGRYNTAVGKGALRITESSGNTALGSFALFNSNSYSNTAIGGFSMQSATTGNSTVSIGYTTLRNFQTGSGNVAMGNAALVDLTSGGFNTVLGHNNGRGITNGSNNTILGARVGGLAANLSNNIIIADGAGNQRIRILSNGDMGVGTDTPTEKLEVNGTIKATDINFTGLATYADEAAATIGGLTTGDMYKTSTGELRIKL